MIDFPASPTVGQVFQGWTFDGVKWASTPSGGSFPEAPTDGNAYMRSNSGWTSGGTLKSDLVINGDTNTLTLNGPSNNWAGLLMKSPAGQGNWLGAFVGGKQRWEIDLGNGVAESGSNAGSNFQIARFNDAGTFIDDPLIIRRSDGLVSVNALSAPQAIGDNRICNGDMRIDQRNNGASGTASGYTVDRWSYTSTQASKGSWGRNGGGSGLAGPPGFPYSLGFASLSAYAPLTGDSFAFYQAVEADFVSDFQWGAAGAQPVTLSFWVNCTLSGTFSGSIRNYTATRSYPFSYSIPTANTWTKIVITIPGDTAGTWVMSGNGGALFVAFDLGSGATFRGSAGAWVAGNIVGVTGTQNIVATNGATFYLTGVKLEVGGVATPFNRQSLAKSMADCQRYYQTTTFAVRLNASAASQYFTIPLAWPSMRANPNPTLLTAGTHNNIASVGVGAYSLNCGGVTFSSTAAGDTYVSFETWALSAEL